MKIDNSQRKNIELLLDLENILVKHREVYSTHAHVYDL